MDYNYTAFYTENFGKLLCTLYNTISLNIGDYFIDKDGNIYEVVYKMFNAGSGIMMYQGRLVNENLK